MGATIRTTKQREPLDNSLRPEGLLRMTMSLEEATRWLKTFESYLLWNEPIIENKGTKCVPALLESLLDTSVISWQVQDQTVTEWTPIQGPSGYWTG